MKRTSSITGAMEPQEQFILWSRHTRWRKFDLEQVNGELKIFRLPVHDLWSISVVRLRNISTETYGSLSPDAGFTWYLITRFFVWVWIVSEHIVINCPVCDTTQMIVFASYESLLLGVWQRKVLECSSQEWRSSLEPWYFKERLWHMSWCFRKCIYIPLFVQADRWRKVASSSLEGQFAALHTFITLKTS